MAVSLMPMRRKTMTFSGLLKGVLPTSVNDSLQCSFASDFFQGIVTKFDLFTIPVHDVWYQVSVYAPDQANACIDAFTEWQMNGSSDLKSTVAMIIGLDAITVGLLYSKTSVNSEVFEPFNKLTPLVVAVPPTNGTIHSLTQILASTSSTDPMRLVLHSM
jgi:hypothetical protein